MKRKRAMFTSGPAVALAIRPVAMSCWYWIFADRRNETIGSVATVVTIGGPLEQRCDLFDGYDGILGRFREACEAAPPAVVLRVDSPGGECAGLFELVRQMREIADASGKRVVTYVDENAYSAAYAIACVGSEIYLPPSGGVGSVGVIATCLDRSANNEMHGINVEVVSAGARKADCHPDVPLSDDAIAVVQADVDRLAEMFFELVASARGMSAEDVAALEAGCLMGEDALSAGLADGVMGFDELVALLASDSGIATEAASEPHNDGENAMQGKKKIAASANGKITNAAAAATAIDILAKPQVAAPTAEQLAHATAKLGKPEAAYEKHEKNETTVKESSEDEETTTETTTTTTTESDTKEKEKAAEETAEEDDDEEEDGDDGEDAAHARPAPLAIVPGTTAPGATSADVLKLVAELTGSRTPRDQATALRSMHAMASKAKDLAATAKSVSLGAMVDAAISGNKLAPAQREWAMTQSPKSLKAYLANAGPVAPTTPLRQKKEKAQNGATQPSATGETVVTDAIAAVARQMGMDPLKVAEHHAELVAAGTLIH